MQKLSICLVLASTSFIPKAFTHSTSACSNDDMCPQLHHSLDLDGANDGCFIQMAMVMLVFQCGWKGFLIDGQDGRGCELGLLHPYEFKAFSRQPRSLK